MKKFLLLGTILIATSAFAFGGGRSGRVHERYKTGVDAIGVHRQIDNNEQADIKFECDDSNAHPDEHGACVCNEGYVEDEGTCVLNQCEDFTSTECILTCDPATGEKTYATLCHNDEYYCNNNHDCVNPCGEAQYNTECQTCSPTGGNADIQDKTGTCGTGGAYICQSGICTDPCTITEHETNACTPSWHAKNGECVPDYAQAGTSCGENKICDGAGTCGCAEGYEDVGGTCMEKCPTGITRNADNSCTVCANGNVYLSYAEAGHECDTATPKNMECTKNSDCTGEKCSAESGKCFCDLTSPSSGDIHCVEITGGTCARLYDGIPITYTHTYTSGGKSETKPLLFLEGPMNWIAAENWCKAHHMNLVKASTLGCTINGDSGSCPSSVYSDLRSAGLSDYINLWWTAENYN